MENKPALPRRESAAAPSPLRFAATGQLSTLGDYTRFMKIRTIIISFVATLCIVSCSKQSGMVSKSKGLVPTTAAEIAASPDFKLEHTTKSGLKIYARELTPEIAKTISVDSPDFRFLQGDRQHICFFLVLIRGGRIVDADKDFDDVKSGDLGEILSVTMQHMQKAQEIFKGATNK